MKALLSTVSIIFSLQSAVAMNELQENQEYTYKINLQIPNDNSSFDASGKHSVLIAKDKWVGLSFHLYREFEKKEIMLSLKPSTKRFMIGKEYNREVVLEFDEQYDLNPPLPSLTFVTQETTYAIPVKIHAKPGETFLISRY